MMLFKRSLMNFSLIKTKTLNIKTNLNWWVISDDSVWRWRKNSTGFSHKTYEIFKKAQPWFIWKKEHVSGHRNSLFLPPKLKSLRKVFSMPRLRWEKTRFVRVILSLEWTFEAMPALPLVSGSLTKSCVPMSSLVVAKLEELNLVYIGSIA